MLPEHSQSSLGGWHNFEKRERIGKREGGYLKRGIIPHSELCSRALLVLGTCRKTAWLESYANFKIYDATAWLTNIVMHTLPNTSRSKGNQTIKFGQLVKYNMRSVFLEKSDTKYGGEISPLLLFLHNCWRKIFLLVYSINWPSFVVWLPLFCEILGNMCIAIAC